MATPTGHKPLPGSERTHGRGSSLIEQLEASEPVAFTLLLRRRPDAAPLHDFEHWQNTPPGKRKFLSSEEFARAHGAAGEDFEKVTAFLKSKGLRVLESDAGWGRLVVEGTAAKVSSAFGITLNRYRVPNHFIPRPALKRKGSKGERHSEEHAIADHVYRGFEGPLHLPPELVDIVRAIIGIDNRRVGGPAGVGTGDPAGANSLLVTTIGQRYNFPTNAAAGQTIGLFAAADEGAAYLPADVTLFISSLPFGHNTPPNVTPIGLTVGAITYSNNTSLITGGSPGGAAQETTQDVQTAAAIGQGANINVYLTENSEAGWEAFFFRALNPKPGDNSPTVLSASWVLYFQDDASVIGNPAASGSFSNIITGYLQTAAMRGITALIAIGDWGASNQVVDGHCHVGYPNSDPWFTSCGGTILGTTLEQAWSDANTGTPFDLGIYDATGGGVSDTFPVPPYQTAAGVLPISKNDGNSRRGVPDIAGMVAVTGLFIDGGGYSFTGTSCVAPLYAGLMAVINAFLGHSVGFLNPTLYTYGPLICHDITIGNNDYGPPIPPLPPGTADSPFYTTDIGWDPCTGWGSLNGLRLLAALAPAPIIETAIAGGPFAMTCPGSFADEILTINNTGFETLLISNIVLAPATDFATPSVTSYPLAVAPGASMDVVIRFNPSSPGAKSATLTIFSNDLFGPHAITVNGTAGSPRLVSMIADSGNFGNVCIGSFKDEPLVLSNSGTCALSITGITSSSGDFLAPSVLSYPLAVAPGSSVSAPIRFEPTVFGPTAPATITIASNDPAGPKTVSVRGNAPSGTIVVTGSTCFGGVRACCSEERTIAICNVGDCKLRILSVVFKRKSRHWKLINSPFPATLHPGSCLALMIRYKATEKCPRSNELIITSDDPVTPVKTLELMAYTIWSECGSKPCCDDCKKGGCDKCHPVECCDDCCDDEDEDES